MDSHGGSLHAQVNAEAAARARRDTRQHRRRVTVQTLTTNIHDSRRGRRRLFAALHAKKVNPDLDVTIAVKGLLGKCGCTRMVQGGYNVALSPEDSVERHFMDTIEGGGGSAIRISPGFGRNSARVSANWKPNSAASSTAIPTAPCTRRPLPGRPSIACA
jgi:hypothetical protein